MSRTIDQQIVSKNEDGSGMATVLASDDNGNQYVATIPFGSGYLNSEAEAIEQAAQEAVNKS